MQRAQADFLQSLPHQHGSLDVLQELWKTSRQPLFNTIMSLQYITAAEEHQPDTSSISFEHAGGQDPNEVRNPPPTPKPITTLLTPPTVRHVRGSGDQPRLHRHLSRVLEHQHHRRPSGQNRPSLRPNRVLHPGESGEENRGARSTDPFSVQLSVQLRLRETRPVHG